MLIRLWKNAPKYSTPGFLTLPHGILDQPREIVLALFPSITLISGALLIFLLRGRRMRAVSVISGAIAFAAAAALSVLLPTQMSIALWRPIEVFGAGFIFSIDKLVWPFLLLASAAVFAEVLLDGRSAIRLLYSGVALAAIAGGNMLAIAVLWTLMILLESVLRLRNSLELDATIQKATVQFVAVAAVLAAVAIGEGTSILLVLAALIRSIRGKDER